MVKNYEEIKNWNDFSKFTQSHIQTAREKKLDAVGLFMTKKYNPNETISLLQSLADPKYIGDINNVDVWRNKSNQRVRGAFTEIGPYMDVRYSAHIAKSMPNCLEAIQFPLVSNFSSKSIYAPNEYACPRFEKLVKIYSEQLKVKFNLKHISSSEKYFKQTFSGYDVFEQTTYNSNYKLNEYDKVVLISSIVAYDLLEKFKKSNAKYEDIKAKFSKEELAKIDYLANDLLTLGIMRATDLGNSEISYKIDEALKLQFSNDMALVASAGNDLTKAVATLVEMSAENIAEKLNFTKERIVDNMEKMGFKYSKFPKTVVEAIFSASNLEKSHEIELAGAKKNLRAKHALTGAALQAGITNLKQELPGIIDAFILTDKEKAEIGQSKNEIVPPAESLMFILKRKNKERLFAPVILGVEAEKKRVVSEVIDRFIEQDEEDFGKTYKQRLNDSLNELYSDGERKSYSGTLVRKMVKNQIRSATNAEREAKRQAKENVEQSK